MHKQTLTRLTASLLIAHTPINTASLSLFYMHSKQGKMLLEAHKPQLRGTLIPAPSYQQIHFDIIMQKLQAVNLVSGAIPFKKTLSRYRT